MRIMRRTMMLALLGAACATGLVGCGELGGDDTDTVYGLTGDEDQGVTPAPGLVPQAQPPVEDVPVPIGFKLVEPMSRSLVTGGERKVEHTYQGRAEKFDVKRFYARQMPLSGWKLISEQFVSGEFALHFSKDEELAEVTLTSQSSWGRERTTVGVSIGPRSDAEAANE